ncbi:MANSC domain-containing protein 1 [Silurus meridionalis]|uniref:MANSC domain-containing protein n=1 Tax=Silurus meridionalis TaxID=175797 RepID=A0A8T0AN23_SILME|nr:MANSC domain-containing protein 1 [Silurus meridionalis]XP_046730333.1 MANSC domain-containing protein 1 [Silurus meridionalis]KAF7694206.1 hypothetical protein HF521_007959 [Silurus meridionalis]
MFPVHRHSFRAVKLLLGALIFLQACSCALSSSGETCYSRQHRDTVVNVAKALNNQKTVMDKRRKDAERDCILSCCSEELKPGIKCNMVMFKPLSQDGIENCYLFHCETEQDCPLMSVKPGSNTYDIFKGLTHPSTKGKDRVSTMPFTLTKQPPTQCTSTTIKPMTTTTTTEPTSTTTTTQSSTTTAPSKANPFTTAASELAIILLTMPADSMPTTTSPMTTTTTTQSTSTTTKLPSTTSTTTTMHPVQPPQPPPNPVRPSKKQVRPPKKMASNKVGEIPTIQKQATQKPVIPTTVSTSTTTTTTTAVTTPTTTTTTTTPTTTTTTTTPTTTTTITTPTTTTTTTPTTTTTTTFSTTTTSSATTKTTIPSTTTTTTPTTTTTTTTTTSTTTTERTTIVVVEMENDLKNVDSNSDPTASASDKSKESHLMWKNSLALLVVLTLIILTFVVAIVGRRAMESFDRRHYTRLELNDLHYEI